MTLLQAWFALCIIMAIRDTSEDAYDEDYHMQALLYQPAHVALLVRD